MATTSQQYGSHYGRSTTGPKPKIGRSTLDFLMQDDKKHFMKTQENIAQRSRNGLFSHPMGLAPGDVYHDPKPESVPVNVMVNKRLVQKVGPQLFSKLSSTNIGDMYRDQFRAGQLYQKEKNDLSLHQNAFLAGGKQKLVKHSEFEHKKQYEDKVYKKLDSEGKVITNPRNFLSNNMKKGYGNTTVGHLFGDYKYEHSPYDNQKQLQSKQKLIHKAHIEKPFTTAAHPTDTFTPDHQAFQKPVDPYVSKDEDAQFRSKSNHKWNYNNPNKKGLYGTFSQFPKYIQQGQFKQEVQKHPIWKHNFNGTSKGFGQTLAKPSPAPSQLILNEIRRTKN